MPQSIDVTLGDKTYTVQALPIRQSAAWRRRLAEPFGNLAHILNDAGQIELTNGNGLANVIQVIEKSLIGSVDILLELLFAYSPALAADRERIESQAYDDEAMRAFVEIVRLAYPFGKLTVLVSGSMRMQRPTG
jgi:hypothetical protein